MELGKLGPIRGHAAVVTCRSFSGRGVTYRAYSYVARMPQYARLSFLRSTFAICWSASLRSLHDPRGPRSKLLFSSHQALVLNTNHRRPLHSSHPVVSYMVRASPQLLHHTASLFQIPIACSNPQAFMDSCCTCLANLYE